MSALHTTPSGNVWTWVDFAGGYHWQRNADDEVCEFSQLAQVNAHDARHPVKGRAELDVEHFRRMVEADQTTLGRAALSIVKAVAS